MGMGGGSGDSVIADINVTPLVDVCLVLVIIFMVTAPMVMQAGIVVGSSSVTAAEGQVAQNESIAVKITEEGIFLNKQSVTLEALPEVMQAKLKVNKKKVVTITAREKVKHGLVVEVLDIAKQSGAEGLSIMREPVEKKVKRKRKRR